MKGLSCLFWNIMAAILLLLGFLASEVYSQESQFVRCGTHRDSVSPEHKQYLDWLDQEVDKYIKQSFMRNSDGNVLPVITIPIVVHVLYSTPAENVPDQVIYALIDSMNKDFMSNRPEVLSKITPMFRHLVGNPRIQFCLATVDPNGNPTTGILRVPTTTSCFSDNSMKIESPVWDPSRYFNLWLVDFCGGSLLGYAQFPGDNPTTDGVVMDYRTLPGGSYFGFNEGRTITHEIGHWLGLYHIWGDGDCNRDDGVGDTPPASGEETGCPTGPRPQCGYPDRMYHNYMDYTRDACLLMFSKGQALRMRAVLELDSRRAQLKYSNGCSAPGKYDLAIVALNDNMYPSQPEAQLCIYKVQPVVNVQNKGSVNSPNATLTCSAGGNSVSFNIPSLTPGQRVKVTMPIITLQEGTYKVTCNVTSSGDPVSFNNSLSYEVTTPVSCSYTENFETVEHPSVKLFNANIVNWSDYQWVLTSTDDIIGSNGNPTKAFVFMSWWAQTGKSSMFTTPYIYLSTTTTSATLTFDVAYSQYNNSMDKLEVFVVDYCGQQLIPLGSWAGSALATAPPSSAEWRPSNASHWKQISLDLTPFKGKTIALAFKATSGAGNNIYVDNISVSSTGCQAFVSSQFPENNAYIKPFVINPSGVMWKGKTTNIRIQIFSLAGSLIKSSLTVAVPNTLIPFNNLPEGVYVVELEDINADITYRAEPIIILR